MSQEYLGAFGQLARRILLVTAYSHCFEFLSTAVCTAELAAVACLLQTKDPVEYVQALLEMRDKYELTISRAFNDDKSFRNTLNQVWQLM